jgi:hypothetical protein
MVNAFKRGGLYAITRPGRYVGERGAAEYRLRLAVKLLRSTAWYVEYSR